MFVSRNALVRGFLCSPAGDDAGGGGAAGDEKKFLTEEQFGELFNRAFTSKWRDLEKKLGTAQSERDQEFLTRINTSFDEKLDKLLKNDDPEPGKDGKSNVDDPVKRQLETLASQLETEKKAREAAEAKTQEVESQRRFDGARQQLRTLLKDKAHPDFLDDWIDRLTVVQKRLAVADDGTTTLRVKHTPYKGAAEEETDLPLDQAVLALFQRPEEKRFQGVPAASGDKGTRGPSGQRGTGSPNIKSDNPVERAAARLQAMGTSLEEEFGGLLG